MEKTIFTSLLMLQLVFVRFVVVWAQTNPALCMPNALYCGRQLALLGYTNTIPESLYQCTSEQVGSFYQFCDAGCATDGNNTAFCKCETDVEYCDHELFGMGWFLRNHSGRIKWHWSDVYRCINGEDVVLSVHCRTRCMANMMGNSVCSTNSSYTPCVAGKTYCLHELLRMGYRDHNNTFTKLYGIHRIGVCLSARSGSNDFNRCIDGCIVIKGNSLCDPNPHAAIPPSCSPASDCRPSPSPELPYLKALRDYCGNYLVANGFPDLNSQILYQWDGNIKVRPKPVQRCSNDCVGSANAFCKPTCSRVDSLFCGDEVKEFKKYSNLSITTNGLYRCINNGKWVELVKMCKTRCHRGESHAFCSNWRHDFFHWTQSQQSTRMIKVHLETGKGTVKFAIKPFSQQEHSLSVRLGSDLILTIMDTEAILSGKGSSYFTKNDIKQPESNLLHFNATEQFIWLSFCNRQPFIKVGYGYVMDLNTLFFFSTDYNHTMSLAIINKVSYVGFTNETSIFSSLPKFYSETVVVDKSPVVVESNSRLNQLEKYPVLVASQLEKEAKVLYDKIARIDLKSEYVDLMDAINYSLDMDGCSLNRKLKAKANTTFGTNNIKMSYIRVTIGPDLGSSPGVPYVLEIWPKGHHSPIHNHGNTVGVIKLVHGTLRSLWYNPLVNESFEQPQKIKEEYLREGTVTWMDPEIYQTHQLYNDRNDTAAVSIQAYAYQREDKIQKEAFNYIIAEDKYLHYFYPNSDYNFSNFVDLVQQEYMTQTCSTSS